LNRVPEKAVTGNPVSICKNPKTAPVNPSIKGHKKNLTLALRQMQRGSDAIAAALKLYQRWQSNRSDNEESN
jgi:hypothetical protein